jgi:hypothetical protein
MSAHILLYLAVNSKSERKVDSLPLRGLQRATFGTQAHLSDRSAKSHLIMFLWFVQGMTLLLMGSADALPSEPADKPVFMEDMSEQQLASAVS